MRLSIITTITNPDKRQDIWIEALRNYLMIADEVIVVNGGEQILFKDVVRIGHINSVSDLRFVDSYWEKDWSWSELPIHLNKGLDEATGEWIIKLDIDQLINEKDSKILRSQLELVSQPVALLQKNTILPNKKMRKKGDKVFAIRGKFKNQIRFGEIEGVYSDLCSPVWRKNMNNEGVPIGRKVTETGRTGVDVWNFDYTFKTKEVARVLFNRMSLAHRKYFGTSKWGITEDESFAVFLKNMRVSYRNAEYSVKEEDLPESIRERFRSLKPEEFGYNGWGLLYE